MIAGEIGGGVVFLNPLAGDYLVNMRRILQEMIAAME